MSIIASLEGFKDAAFQKLTASGPIANPAATLIALENNLDPIALRRLAESVAADPGLAPEFVRSYAVTLSGGAKTLTGADNNANSLDDVLIDSVMDFDATITGAAITTTQPVQWLPNRSALYNPPGGPDFNSGTVDDARQLFIADYQGNLVSGAPIVAFRSVRIPLVTEVLNRRVQSMLVDILIGTLTEDRQQSAGA